MASPAERSPAIIVQIEPPPISISSAMIGAPGPLGAQATEGKPIVAEFLTENHQSFKDGNRSTRSTTSVIYRDGQGRLRRESQLLLPGLPAGVAARFITIIDRRQGCGWVLDPQEMVAHRYRLDGEGPSYVARLNAQGSGEPLLPPESKASPDSGAMAAARAGAESRRWNPHGWATQPMPLGAEPPEFAGSAAGQPVPMRIGQPFLAAPNPMRTENLGEQLILGYRTHGTRVITTLQAGEIGNEQAIEIVSEQWFSPDLDLVMRSLHRDPWGGEFITAVTRVRRGEQPARLFTVPAQYTMIDADTEEQRHVLVEGRGSAGAPR